MDIIGRHLLLDFWQRDPRSESALRGVLAIVAESGWQDDDDIKRQLGFAVTLQGEGRAAITDPDGRFQFALRINYTLQLVHILSIRGDFA